MKTTNAIIILDGYGLSQQVESNAIKAAKTPYLDYLFKTYPHCVLSASGRDVGLPEAQMGNSEVGHLNLGAGRIVYQDITTISDSINDGSFFENPALKAAMHNAKNKTLHLCGLISDGGVHSTLSHLYALVAMAKKEEVKNVLIHCITDGRDTPPKSALGFIQEIENKCKEINAGKIATVSGRFYAMDRDNRWERVREGYDCIFEGVGQKFLSAKQAVEALYKEKIECKEKVDGKEVTVLKDMTDEFLTPCIIGDYKGFNKNDSFIFFNFRSDRAREIARAATEPDFNLFKREGGCKEPFYVGFTLYDDKLKNVHTAFEPKQITNTLSNWLSALNKTQARVAETEKYAHVTFFFNGGVEAPDKGETRYLIPSPGVKTYDSTPCMSALAVAKKAVETVGNTDVLILNFANCDMVGHTGDFKAAVAAVECVDKCLETVVKAVLSSNGNALILSDHGNAETMAYADGSPFTAHTTNPVPMILAGEKHKSGKLTDGKLCDVAPTFLSVLGLETPKEMTGKNLLK